MKYIIFTACFLLGCFPPDNLPRPDHVTANGVEIYYLDKRWDPYEIAVQERFFLENLPPKYPRIIPPTKVWVVKEYPHNGTQDHAYLVVKDLGCVFNSSYTHEIAHWMQEYFFQVDDYQHQEVALWSMANSSPRGCTK